MAQSKALLRFRARLRSRGYSDVRICKDVSNKGQRYDRFGNPTYLVSCKEPLLDYSVVFVASEPQMNNWPGIPFDHVIYVGKQLSCFDEGDDLD